MKQKRFTQGKEQQVLLSAYMMPCSAAANFSEQAQLTCLDYTADREQKEEEK